MYRICRFFICVYADYCLYALLTVVIVPSLSTYAHRHTHNQLFIHSCLKLSGLSAPSTSDGKKTLNLHGRILCAIAFYLFFLFFKVSFQKIK